VLAADMALFYIYKIARRDFYSWVPGMGIGGTLVHRTVSKLMVDFTGLPHLRNPVDHGGAYYAFSMLINQVICLSAGGLYVSLYPDGPEKLDGFWLMLFLAGLAVVWGLSFGGFLLTIDRRYVPTFLSLKTGVSYAHAYFLDNEDNEELRIEIFDCNRVQWTAIRGEVKAWVQDRYAAWQEEQPPWFTPVESLFFGLHARMLCRSCRVGALSLHGFPMLLFAELHRQVARRLHKRR
jgi:hypothetical protein